jgi:exonuclease SbcD
VLPIKLLHTADIHIGMENYGRTDPDSGLNGRVMDFLRRLSDMADCAIAQGVDLFVFAGDAYRTRDPNPTYQREFARRIKKVADAGIPVVLLVGNHDLPAVTRRATSISIFDTLAVPNTYVADSFRLFEITCRRGQRLQVASAPYPLRWEHVSRAESEGKTLAQLDDLLAESLQRRIADLADEARQQPDVPAILIGHFSVKEASQGSEQNIMIGRDIAVPRSALCDPVWRYVALGHIHKHQSLNRDAQPPVVYSGSIERIDFGEEHEKKGFVLAEIGDDATQWEFKTGYQREARRFLTIRVDARSASDPTAAALETIAGSRGDLAEAVVRVIVRLSQEQEPLLNDREIAGSLEGAQYVAALQKDIVRNDRQRLGGVSVEVFTPAQLLERYLELKGVPAERAGQLLARGEMLIKAVDAGGV